MNSRLFIYLHVGSFACITACLIAFGIWQTRKIDVRLSEKQLPISCAPIFCGLNYGPRTLLLVENSGAFCYVYPGPYKNSDWHLIYRSMPDTVLGKETGNCWPVAIYADRNAPCASVLKVVDSLRSHCRHRNIRLLVKYYPVTYTGALTGSCSFQAGG